MNTITVTVYQDNSGYHVSGYPKSIPSAGLNVIGRETVQYGAAPECRTDPAQPSRVLLHISGPGIGNLWVDETQASITDKVNGLCCGGTGSGGSFNIAVSGLNLSGGGTVITDDRLTGKTVNALGISSGAFLNLGTDFSLAGNQLTLLAGNSVASGDLITVFY